MVVVVEAAKVIRITLQIMVVLEAKEELAEMVKERQIMELEVVEVRLPPARMEILQAVMGVLERQIPSPVLLLLMQVEVGEQPGLQEAGVVGLEEQEAGVMVRHLVGHQGLPLVLMALVVVEEEVIMEMELPGEKEL